MTQCQRLRAVATLRATRGADRDPACFRVSPHDSSPIIATSVADDASEATCPERASRASPGVAGLGASASIRAPRSVARYASATASFARHSPHSCLASTSVGSRARIAGRRARLLHHSSPFFCRPSLGAREPGLRPQGSARQNRRGRSRAAAAARARHRRRPPSPQRRGSWLQDRARIDRDARQARQRDIQDNDIDDRRGVSAICRQPPRQRAMNKSSVAKSISPDPLLFKPEAISGPFPRPAKSLRVIAHERASGVHLFIHGGGMVFGSSEVQDPMLERIVKSTGRGAWFRGIGGTRSHGRRGRYAGASADKAGCNEAAGVPAARSARGCVGARSSPCAASTSTFADASSRSKSTTVRASSTLPRAAAAGLSPRRSSRR